MANYSTYKLSRISWTSNNSWFVDWQKIFCPLSANRSKQICILALYTQYDWRRYIVRYLTLQLLLLLLYLLYFNLLYSTLLQFTLLYITLFYFNLQLLYHFFHDRLRFQSMMMMMKLIRPPLITAKLLPPYFTTSNLKWTYFIYLN